MAIKRAAIAVKPDSWPSTPEDQETAFASPTIHRIAKPPDRSQISRDSPPRLNCNLGWERSSIPVPRGFEAKAIPIPEATTSKAATSWPRSLQ